MTKKYAQCRFCGHKTAPTIQTRGRWFLVTCLPIDGGCGGQTGPYVTDDLATLAWNNASKDAERERLEEALREIIADAELALSQIPELADDND